MLPSLSGKSSNSVSTVSYTRYLQSPGHRCRSYSAMEKPVTLSFFFLLVPLICVLLTESLAGSQRGAGQVPLGRQCCVTAPRHQERWPYSAGWVGSAEIRKQCYVLFRCSLWGGGEQNLNNYKNNTSVKLQLKNLIYNFF